MKRASTTVLRNRISYGLLIRKDGAGLYDGYAGELAEIEAWSGNGGDELGDVYIVLAKSVRNLPSAPPPGRGQEARGKINLSLYLLEIWEGSCQIFMG